MRYNDWKTKTIALSMEKQNRPSFVQLPAGYGHEHAAQERRIVLTVGAFFLLAVAMWLTNKYFGPEHLQSNLVVSGDFGIGTERKSYSTASGATVRVPILIEYPAGQRLSSVRIALSPWPKTATRPTFVLSSGTSAASSVKMTGSGTVVVSLEGVTMAPSNLGDVGSLEFTMGAGSVSSTVGLVSEPSDPNGTMITAVGLGGHKQETRLKSAEFFRIEVTGGTAVTPTASGSALPSSSFRPSAGSGFLASPSPRASVYRLPNVASLLRRAFGVVIKTIPATGSGLTVFRSVPAGSGSELKGAAPTGRLPTTPGVDLAVELQAPQDKAEMGRPFPIKAVLRNDGATKATNTKFSLTAPAELKVVEMAKREGCAIAGQAVTCSFPTMDPGQIIGVTVDLRATTTGNFALQATLKGDQNETDTADNQAKATVLTVKASTAIATPTPVSTPGPTPTGTPRPTAAPIAKLPKTGPLPLGMALISSGLAILMLRRRFS